VLSAAVVVLALVAGACTGSSPGANGDDGPVDELVVAAASDLRPVFDELARRHETATGVRVSVVYGSSGLLARQALQGAPFDVFASADTARAGEVAADRPGDGTTPTPFATGRLVLVGAGDGAGITDLAAPDAGLVAIANPEHAPYGQAAEEALRAAGVWDAIQDRLVLADNVADAARLVVAGEVDAALVAASLVEPDAPGGAATVPDALHTPIRQSLLVLVPAAPSSARRRAAEEFVARVLSPGGRELLAARGFSLPGVGP
jgi:molybdate transport system substrate-binding protein